MGSHYIETVCKSSFIKTPYFFIWELFKSSCGLKHLTLNPDFEPKEPIIHVNLIDKEQISTEIEWDVQACKSFCLDNGRWLRLRPNEPVPSWI